MLVKSKEGVHMSMRRYKRHQWDTQELSQGGKVNGPKWGKKQGLQWGKEQSPPWGKRPQLWEIRAEKELRNDSKTTIIIKKSGGGS